MTNPDPLLMSADIARVASERPELDEELVAALYQHLVLIEARQPTVAELREYVDRVLGMITRSGPTLGLVIIRTGPTPDPIADPYAR